MLVNKIKNRINLIIYNKIRKNKVNFTTNKAMKQKSEDKSGKYKNQDKSGKYKNQDKSGKYKESHVNNNNYTIKCIMK